MFTNAEVVKMGLALLHLGLFLVIAIGMVHLHRRRKFSVRTTAMCVKVDERVSGMNGKLYAPVFRYKYLGKSYEARGKYEEKITVQLGERKEIRIDPVKHQEIYISWRITTARVLFWLLAIILIAAGLLLMYTAGGTGMT